MRDMMDAIRVYKHRAIMVGVAIVLEAVGVIVIKIMSTSVYADIIAVFGILLIGTQFYTVINYVNNCKRLTFRLADTQRHWVIIDDDENVVYKHSTLQGLQTDNNLIFSSIPHAIVTNYRVMNPTTNEVAGHIEKTVQYHWTPKQEEDA